MNKTLTERVARAMCAASKLPLSPDDEFETTDGRFIPRWQLMVDQANAAIALVLHEAAKVAVDGPCGQPEYAWDYWCGYSNGKRAAAAAIRSLTPSEEPPASS